MRLLVVAAAATGSVSFANQNCTADEDCIPSALRCLPSPGGSPCTLDYAFNETGECACLSQGCDIESYAPATPGTKQWLLAGDSISLGYWSKMSAQLGPSWQVLHVGGNYNCDNAYLGARCFKGWLGANASRWDVISYNAGLHDLAFPDNEHLTVPTYASFIQQSLQFLAAAARAGTRLLWMRTTPVPTAPPADCALIPGRLEKDVAAYNSAADGVVSTTGGRVGSCDLHGAITAYCGVGYSTCNITQCKGPHFSDLGWQILAETAARCGTA